MLRNLKILVVAALAITALSAVAAQAAFAANHYFASEENVFVNGTQETQNVFTVETGVTKCTTATFKGTAHGTLVETGKFGTESLKVHPTYGTCKLAGISATVNTGNETNGCFYTFTNTGGSEAAGTTNSVQITCTGTQTAITVVKEGCTVTVPPQSGLNTVKMTNQGTSPKKVLVTAEVTGIKYTESGTCSKNGEHTNGTYTGTVLTHGNKDTGGTEGTESSIWVA